VRPCRRWSKLRDRRRSRRPLLLQSGRYRLSQSGGICRRTGSYSTAGRTGKGWAHKYWVAAAAVLFVALFGGGLGIGAPNRAHRKIESIAVIPFVPRAATLTRLPQRWPHRILNREPGHLPELKVKSRNSVFRYKGKDVDPQQVGKALTVDALLTGRVVQRGDTIQVQRRPHPTCATIPKSGASSNEQSFRHYSLQQQMQATSPTSSAQSSAAPKNSK